MDQFWGAMLGALLGAAFGTLSTLFTTWITQRFADRRAELAALSDLVMELHYRPSLLPVRPVRIKAGPKLDAEIERRMKSAVAMRELIEKTGRHLPPGSRALKAVGAMHAAVNVYVEAVDGDRAGVQIYAEDLRHALTRAVAEMHRQRPGVPELVPGVGVDVSRGKSPD